MKNILLYLAYDGSGFEGWQEQAGRRTVGGEVRRAVEEVTGRRIHLIAAGRTDAGVHADQQLANFLTDSEIPGQQFYHHLHRRLPADILCYHSEEVPPSFHSRFWALQKTYRYELHCGRLLHPKERNYRAFCSYPLNIDQLRLALGLFEGKHDFSSFCIHDPDRQPIRVIDKAGLSLYSSPSLSSLEDGGKDLVFHFKGESFLRSQVRMMVGAAIEVGRGRMSLDQLEEALKEGKSPLPIPSYPARGLTLEEVLWRKEPVRWQRG